MNLPRNINTFFKNLPLKNMSGEDIFVAISFFLTGGKCEAEVEIKEVKKSWSKSIIGKPYNSAYSTRAKGRVHSSGRGITCLTEEGISYVQDLMGEVPTFATTLLVFRQGNAHSFDKFLRGVLKKAAQNVFIADTYVSGALFDTLLGEIPDDVSIQFVYGSDVGGFVARATRFAKQYKKFEAKESKQFHDRFLIIDGKGYISGPSLKDAADKKPATLVVLGESDSKKLTDLFTDLWNGK